MASFFSIHVVCRYQDCSLLVVLYHMVFVGSSHRIGAWITFVYNHGETSNLHCKVVRLPSFCYPDYRFQFWVPSLVCEKNIFPLILDVLQIIICDLPVPLSIMIFTSASPPSINNDRCIHISPWSPRPSLNHNLYFCISSLYQSWPLHPHFSLSSLSFSQDQRLWRPFLLSIFFFRCISIRVWPNSSL